MKYLFLLPLLIIPIIFLPFLQPFIMLFYIHPLWIILLLCIGIFLWLLRTPFKKIKIHKDKGTYSITSGKNVLIMQSILLGIIFLLGVFIVFLENEFRYQVTASQLQIEKLSKLPTFQPIRLTPRSVATRYAEDSFQSPQEYLGKSQIVFNNGKLQRIFPRLPDGNILYFLNKLTGFVIVDVDTLERKVAIEDQKFEIAENIGIFDNVYYRLRWKKFFVTYSSEPVYVKNSQNEWVMIIPYIDYKGLLIRVPYWAGIMEVHTDGTIIDYSVDEVKKREYLANNRAYPRELSEYYADAYAYKNGILNTWFFHKDQTEIVTLSKSERVLHVPTTNGYKQMLIAEPYGRSYGIYKIFFFDAATGKMQLLEYNQKSQLTGPVAAADYIKREFPTYDWSSFTLTEPRPLSINNDLYWLLSIIPNDAAGIASTVLLHTKTNKVFSFTEEAQLQAFLRGMPLTNTPTSKNNDLQDQPEKSSNQQIKDKIDSIQKELDDLKKLLN